MRHAAFLATLLPIQEMNSLQHILPARNLSFSGALRGNMLFPHEINPAQLFIQKIALKPCCFKLITHQMLMSVFVYRITNSFVYVVSPLKLDRSRARY
jgi:hypothetical protein